MALVAQLYEEKEEAALESKTADINCLEDGTMELLLEDRIFARYITALGYITPKQAQECLRLQTRILEKGHRKVRFVDVLVARKYLTKDQVIRARQTFC